MHVCSRRSMAIPMFPSIRSSPTRNLPRINVLSWPSRWLKMNCGLWIPSSSSGTWQPGTTTRASICRKTRCSLRISKSIARRTICPVVKKGSQTTRSRRLTSEYTCGKRLLRSASRLTVTRSPKPVLGLKFDAPGGSKEMDEVNHHTFKPVFIGEIRADGQFDVISKSKGLVKPEAFSSYLKK